jgi:hypothetical protein
MKEANTGQGSQEVSRKPLTLPWGNLPAKYRLGEHQHDTVKLYRGDRIEKLTDGIEPTTSRFETSLVMDEIDKAIVQGSAEQDIPRIIGGHLTYAHKDGSPTPFVSASTLYKFAEGCAIHEGTEGRGVAEIEVPVNRVIAIRSMEGDEKPLEVLVFDGVLPEEVKAVTRYTEPFDYRKARSMFPNIEPKGTPLLLISDKKTPESIADKNFSDLLRELRAKD